LDRIAGRGSERATHHTGTTSELNHREARTCGFADEYADLLAAFEVGDVTTRESQAFAVVMPRFEVVVQHATKFTAMNRSGVSEVVLLRLDELVC
jgi:hypothetical protein